MSVREDIVPYIDTNNMVAPNKGPFQPLKGSDNGPCYTGEFYSILAKSGILTEDDKLHFANIIGSCIDKRGVLNRVPIDKEDGQEAPDDYYGVLSACKELGNVDIPREFLKGMLKNAGFMNNVDGTKTLKSFMLRQPQLVAAMVAGAFPSLTNPIELAIRTCFFPFFLVAAVVIAISCVRAPITDTDSRRLSWHLIQSVAPVSVMCKLASLIWYHRLYKDYPGTGMRGVAAKYYQPGHPFITNWVD